MILAGDIGGTNIRLGLFDARDLRQPQVVETYRSAEFALFSDAIERFRREHRAVLSSSCVGVAGPVRNGRGQLVNLPWAVDESDLRHWLGLAHAWVINDLEANAHSIPLLVESDWVTLNAGANDARGNVAVIAAGTGLGEAGLFWDGSAYYPLATEGGHADFAPRDETDWQLLSWLRAQFGHVSWERVVCGSGLVNLYRFMVEAQGGTVPLPAIDLAAADAPAKIAAAAVNGGSQLCSAVMERFWLHYGAEAGNLALKLMATGGVYVGGGIAPKNLDGICGGAFMNAFLYKGRMSELVGSMPVRVIMNQLTPLLGAARCAHARSK